MTTYNVDWKLDQTLEGLRQHYGAASKADVLRKAVALLKLFRENEQPDGSVLIRTGQRSYVRVLVRTADPHSRPRSPTPPRKGTP
jgi:hypothetical protein